MRQARHSLVLPLSLVLALAAASDPAPGQDESWKRHHDLGNRYEGRIGIPVSRPDLELLSFVGFRERFEGDVSLAIRFFLPTEALNSKVFIHGRELRERRQYWMESKPSDWKAGQWNELEGWSTGDVLVREGVPWSNLGIAIRLDSESVGSGEVAPAFVYHSEPPGSCDAYTVFLRPNTRLKEVHYTLYRIEGDRETEVASSSLFGEKIPGEPFPIELKLGAVPEGRMRLVVEGRPKGRTGRAIREYSFYHKPVLR